MKKILILLCFIAILTAGAGATLYFFRLYSASQKQISDLTANVPLVTSVNQDDANLIAKVARHILLPDEAPIIQTVMDVGVFKNEPFYKNAKNGDKILVYSNRAILYNPDEDRIIEVGVVRQNETVVTATSSSAPAVAGESTSSAVLGPQKILKP
jgi:hypothetical protein